MSQQLRTGRPSKRHEVLDAATRVALRDGPGAVTVDSVVSEAGLSRGGVLYHFPTKDALLQALVDRDIETVRRTTGLGTHAAAASAADRVRSYYAACTAWPTERGHVALAVALADNPALLDSWAQVQRELDELDGRALGAGDDPDDPDGPDVLAALVSRLALDGLWFSDLIDPDRFTAEQRRRLVAAIVPAAVSTTAPVETEE